MKPTDFLNMPTDPIRAALERLLNDLQCLILKSQGVSGLCHDGDLVTWPDLLKPGGCYSPWIGYAIAAARNALAADADPDPADGGEALLAAAPAAEGEVAELVAWLLQRCQLMSEAPGSEFHLFTRAATLLQQQAAELATLRVALCGCGVVPVAVSEGLPRPAGDRDGEGRCWWFCFECPGEHSYWILAKEVYCNPTYWLPFHAIPLPSPQGENPSIITPQP